MFYLMFAGMLLYVSSLFACFCFNSFWMNLVLCKLYCVAGGKRAQGMPIDSFMKMKFASSVAF